MKSLLTICLALVLSLGFTKPAFSRNPSSSFQVCVVLVAAYDDDDANTVKTIFTTLSGAQKVAKALNAQVTVSDDAISDDVFVFSLKSPEQNDMAMKLLDEEGYSVGDNAFTVTEGNNYKRVNVRALNDGTYTFKIVDKEGKEFSKNITVKRGAIVTKN